MSDEREKVISILARVLKHGLDRAGETGGRFRYDLAHELDQEITNLLGELVAASPESQKERQP